MNTAIRDELEAALATYAELQQGCPVASEIARFVRTEERWWDRRNTGGHVTASAWIVDPSEGATLLVHHRKLNRWLQPGGHLEDDTSIHGAALREAQEETGLTDLRWRTTAIFDVDIHLIPARPDFPAHRHLDIRFAFEASHRAPLHLSTESYRVAWWPLTGLTGATTDASVFRLAQRTLDLASTA